MMKSTTTRPFSVTGKAALSALERDAEAWDPEARREARAARQSEAAAVTPPPPPPHPLAAITTEISIAHALAEQYAIRGGQLVNRKNIGRSKAGELAGSTTGGHKQRWISVTHAGVRHKLHYEKALELVRNAGPQDLDLQPVAPVVQTIVPQVEDDHVAWLASCAKAPRTPDAEDYVPAVDPVEKMVEDIAGHPVPPAVAPAGPPKVTFEIIHSSGMFHQAYRLPDGRVVEGVMRFYTAQQATTAAADTVRLLDLLNGAK